MIRSNLAVLLAERNLRISRVSADTGISRTTLTALSSNNFQGIQMETLNQLCQYLNVRPEGILHYVPFDLELLRLEFEPHDSAVAYFSTTINGKPERFDLPFVFQFREHYEEAEEEWCASGEFYAELWPEEEYNVLPLKVFKLLPVPFLKDLETKLSLKGRYASEHDIKEDHTNFSFYWGALNASPASNDR